VSSSRSSTTRCWSSATCGIEKISAITPRQRPFQAQAREVAELAGARVIAAIDNGHVTGFAQVEIHDGGSEISQVFVRPERRGAGLGGALTAQGIRVASDDAPQVWICAERDNRPRRLYQRVGFRPVVETGIGILSPSDRAREPRHTLLLGRRHRSAHGAARLAIRQAEAGA
jgi:GNAT superfamily N-acetyltransferase